MSPLDIAAFHLFNGAADTPQWLVLCAVWATNGLPWLGGAALAGTWFIGARAARRVILLCVVSMLVTWCMVRGIRAWIPMPRPAELGIGIQWISHGIRPGFPSMHAAGAMAFVAGLWFAGARRYALVALPLALAVVWSRVFLGVHFPSDVIAGMVCAIVGAGATAGGYQGLKYLRAVMRCRSEANSSTGTRQSPSPPSPTDQP